MHLPISRIISSARFLPGLVATIEFHHVVAHHGEHFGSVLAAVTAAAIHSNSTALVEQSRGFLTEMPGHDIYVHTAWDVAGVELLWSTHIDKLYTGTGYRIGKGFNRDRMDFALTFHFLFKGECTRFKGKHYKQ